MQIRLLPTLINPLQNLLKKKKPEERKQHPKHRAEASLSPNLFDPHSYKLTPVETLKSTSPKKSTKTLTILVLTFQTIALLVIVFNSHINSQIDTINLDLAKLALQTNKDYQTEEKTTNIVQKTELYKKILSERVPVSEKVNYIMNETPNSLKIDTLSYEKETVKMETHADSALSFALLAQKYLSNEAISQITLVSAKLTTYDTFEMYIEVKFK